MKKGLFIPMVLLALAWTSPVQATFRCQNKPLYVNQDAMSDVLEKCGEPAFRTQKGSSTSGRVKGKAGQKATVEAETEEKTLLVEEWVYHCRQRKWTLTFEGGVLKAIKQGERLGYGDERNRSCGN